MTALAITRPQPQRRLTVASASAPATVSAPATARPRASASNASAELPPLRLTTRGRRLLGVLAALALTGAVTFGSSAIAGPSVEPTPIATTAYTFAPGESLWLVAVGLAAPGQDIREVVYELMELNGLETAAVQAGQTILVPVR